MKPLISYYGAKQRLAPQILKYLPEHKVYVEPYCGGASIFFAKEVLQVSNKADYIEVLNDHDQRLITLYRVCQTRFEELNNLIKYTMYSEAEYKKSLEILNDWDSYDPLWQAWAFYVNIWQSFSKKLKAGWSRSKSSQNAGYSWQNQINRLPEIIDRLKNVCISCTDALICIDQWDSKDTLFYIDPPYIGANQGHYSGFTYNDLSLLCNKLDNIKGKFLLSGYPNDSIPKHWKEIRLSAVSSSSLEHNKLNNKREERLWMK